MLRHAGSRRPASLIRHFVKGNLDTFVVLDVYIHELKDLYSAEKQIMKALPKMAKAADNAQFKAGVEKHLEETKEHDARLEKVLASHGETTRGPKCRGMAGLLEKGDEMIEEEAGEEVRDAGLISAAQSVELYEMAGYGRARAYLEGV